MWTDRVSSPGPLTCQSSALPTALHGPAGLKSIIPHLKDGWLSCHFMSLFLTVFQSYQGDGRAIMKG